MRLAGILLYEQDYALEMTFFQKIDFVSFFPHQPPPI